jgi:hypothetical protein
VQAFLGFRNDPVPQVLIHTGAPGAVVPVGVKVYL